MITKNEFIEIIDRLRETDDFVDEVNDKARNLNCLEFHWDYPNMTITHKDIVVDLLENMFGGDDIIGWWIYELDYGREYYDGCIQDANGINIDLSSADKLYDYLISTMG